MAFNRNEIAQTGLLPEGTQLLQDTIPLKIIDRKVLTESVNGKRPAMLLTGIFQRADEKNANGRVYPLDVLKEAINDMQDSVKSRGVIGEWDHPCCTVCSLDNAKVLTVDGWKPYDQVKVGDHVFSRVNGEMVPSRVNGIVDEPYDGPMYQVKGKYIDIGYTPNHKMIMDTRRDGNFEAEQIQATVEEIVKDRKKFNKCKIPRKAGWNGEEPEAFVVPGIPTEELKRSPNYHNNVVTEDLQIETRTFVAFLGLYLAEGSLTMANYGIMIHQKKDDYKPVMREMLNKFPSGLKWVESDGGFYLSDARLYKYLKKLGNKYEKYIPEDVKQLDAPYLEELVRWFQLGDGRQKCGRSNVFTTSYRLIRDLHECWVKAGNCCYFTTIETTEDYEFAGHIIKAENKKPLYQLTLSDTDGIYMDNRFLKIEKAEVVNDRIWCLSTEHGSFYMENKGCSFWTGNSDAKIHMDRASHLITKLWMEGKTVYGKIEVINDDRCPCGSMFACYIDRKIQVGISSRGVGDMEVSMNEGEESYMVQPGFKFITFDAVAEPSVKGAQLKIEESLIRKKANTRQVKMFREKILQREINKFLRG